MTSPTLAKLQAERPEWCFDCNHRERLAPYHSCYPSHVAAVLKEAITALDAQHEADAAALEEALSFIRGQAAHHYECEDGWYSCPKSEEGCLNDARTECDCSAAPAQAVLEKIEARRKEKETR